MRALLVAVFGVLAGAPVYAQPAAPAVSLDVVVGSATERGGSLTASDFEVRASGEVLPVRSVRLVQPSPNAAALPAIDSDEAEARAAASANRIVGVYVDEYHLADDEAFAAAKRAVASFLRESLGSRDLVVVLKPLDSVVAIRLGADRDRAASSVERAEARLGDYTARSDFEQNFVAGAPARIEATRRQIVLSGLGALAAHLGRFDGRKTLIVLSNVMPPRDGQARSEFSRAGSTVDGVIRAANIGSVAIYPVRPAMVPSADAQAEDSLARLARETTGFTIDAGASLERGLARVLADASRYYLLTLSLPPDLTRAGFRAVDVRVRRPGVEARGRSGFAVRDPEEDAPPVRVRPLPEGLKVPRRTSTLIRAWFGQSPGTAGQTRVQFVWEPAQGRAGDRTAAARPVRVTLRITTIDGVAVFSGEALPSTGEGTVDRADRTQAIFESAPARLLVQMEVLDLAGRVLDRDVRDLVVAGFEAPVAFGTARVYRARTMRDRRLLAEVRGQAAPVAARQFSRAELLIVRIPVASAGEPQLTVRLMNGFGGVLRPLPTSPVPGSERTFQVELPLSSLASAPYVLEFTARTGAGSAVERLDFVVTP